VIKAKPNKRAVPPIQPAYANARGKDKSPIPTKTAIALKSYSSALSSPPIPRLVVDVD